MTKEERKVNGKNARKAFERATKAGEKLRAVMIKIKQKTGHEYL